MGAFRITNDRGDYVDLHDTELELFVAEAEDLGPNAQYVAQRLAHLLDLEISVPFI